MTTTTLGALVRAEPVLVRLAGLRLSVQVAYHVMKLLKLVQAETPYYEQQRAAFIREHGTREGDEIRLRPTDARWAEYAERMTELAALSVEFAWRPLTVRELEGIDIAGDELAALGPLFDAPDDPPPTDKQDV